MAFCFITSVSHLLRCGALDSLLVQIPAPCRQSGDYLLIRDKVKSMDGFEEGPIDLPFYPEEQREVQLGPRERFETLDSLSAEEVKAVEAALRDRKSTRLNSSH